MADEMTRKIPSTYGAEPKIGFGEQAPAHTHDRKRPPEPSPLLKDAIDRSMQRYYQRSSADERIGEF